MEYNVQNEETRLSIKLQFNYTCPTRIPLSLIARSREHRKRFSSFFNEIMRLTPSFVRSIYI